MENLRQGDLGKAEFEESKEPGMLKAEREGVLSLRAGSGGKN